MEVNQSHHKCILLVMMSICRALGSMTNSIWKFIHFCPPPNNKSSNKGSTAGYSLSTSLNRHSFPIVSHLNSSTWKKINLTIQFSFLEMDFFSPFPFSLFPYGFSVSVFQITFFGAPTFSMFGHELSCLLAFLPIIWCSAYVSVMEIVVVTSNS